MKHYQMFNGFDSRLLSDYPIIQAKTGADATRKLLRQLGIKFTKVKRSASNWVKIKAEPFKYGEDGQKYRNGVVSWFEVWNENSLL